MIFLSGTVLAVPSREADFTVENIIGIVFNTKVAAWRVIQQGKSLDPNYESGGSSQTVLRKKQSGNLESHRLSE